MTEAAHADSRLDRTAPTSRRSLLKAGAWSTPVLALTVAAPLAAASRQYAIESNFGSGWYPTSQGQTTSGVYQFDSDASDKYFRVTGTQVGDVLTNIYVKVLISTGWPAMTLTPLAGSSPSWSTLALTGETEIIAGVTYNVYRTNFTGTLTTTAPTTDVPIGFYWRTATAFFAGQMYQSRRYVTVNGTPVEFFRTPAGIVNTNVITPPAP